MEKSEPLLAHYDLAQCQALYSKGLNQIIYKILVADTQTAVGAMMKLSQGQTHHFLLESVEGGEIRGRFSVIGLSPDLIWRSRGNEVYINRQPQLNPDAFEKHISDNPLDCLRTLMRESEMASTAPLPPLAAGLFGYLGYDMIRHVEKLPDQNQDPLDDYESLLMRPSVVAIFDRLKDSITLAYQIRHADHQSADAGWLAAIDAIEKTEEQLRLPLPSTPVILPAGELPMPESNTTKDRFFEMVRTAKEHIINGDVFQVVLSQRFTIPFALPSFALYRSLRRLNPSPFLFHFALGDLAVVGSSPEILVRLRDGDLTIRPIAGTRPRGATLEEDQINADSLIGDIKERSEHLMLLDLGRNDVGRVSRPGTVQVTSNFDIEYYSHVMHIASEVHGQIRPECDALDALIAGFPAGTVTGAPKIRAMEIIDNLEHDRRGIYAGAIGYISASGQMDTCIALRTAVLKKGKMHIQAGAGIVYDSVEQSEYEECQNKARALLKAAADALQFSE